MSETSDPDELQERFAEAALDRAQGGGFYAIAYAIMGLASMVEDAADGLHKLAAAVEALDRET